jgi:protein disulfide-isomerase
MKRSFFVLFLGLASLTARSDQGPQWFTDASMAQEKARQEKKALLLDFTGSDWCGWCMKLKREAFDQAEFAEFAKTNLILVEVDFPMHKQLEPAQLETNKRLAASYHVAGYPTLILLGSEGRQLGAVPGYLPGGAHALNERLAGFLKSAASPPNPEQPSAKPVAFQPFPREIPIRYESLALKGISGTKQRRMVLINNASLIVGETATVKVQDQRVEVCCKEIRDDSVLITADGKPLELKLGGR